MIRIELEREGILSVSGPMDNILTEYTTLTRLILHRLKEDFDEDTAFTIVAELGKIAAANIDEISRDVLNIHEKVEEVLTNEL